MDVDVQVQEVGHVELLAIGPVHATIAHEECVDSFVGGAVARAESQETRRLEVCLRHCGRFDGGARPLDPFDDLLQVSGETCLSRTAVEFTQDAAPKPLPKLLVYGVLVCVAP